VESKTSQGTVGNINVTSNRQDVIGTILEGEEKGKLVQFTAYNDGSTQNMQLQKGEDVIVRMDPKLDNPSEYFVSYKTKYRLDGLVLILIFFFLLVFVLSGFKGINAVLGLMFTVLTLQLVLLPGMINGVNPMLLTLIVAGLGSTLSLLIAHGWSKRTLVSLVGTVITLLLTVFLSQWIVDILSLTGYATESVIDLKQNNQTYFLDLQGLLLSGIIIGSLGILDDVTTAQATIVQQISIANPRLDSRQLFLRSLEVGKEHIISLINTLALAYIGTGLPIILTFLVFDYSPLWVILNNEIIVEEIARSLIGSTCLMLAIPITALLASRILKTSYKIPNKNFSFSGSLDVESNKN
jgi:uncharacterized membrane protein